MLVFCLVALSSVRLNQRWGWPMVGVTFGSFCWLFVSVLKVGWLSLMFLLYCKLRSSDDGLGRQLVTRRVGLLLFALLAAFERRYSHVGRLSSVSDGLCRQYSS